MVHGQADDECEYLFGANDLFHYNEDDGYRHRFTQISFKYDAMGVRWLRFEENGIRLDFETPERPDYRWLRLLHQVESEEFLLKMVWAASAQNHNFVRLCEMESGVEIYFPVPVKAELEVWRRPRLELVHGRRAH